ncbi:AmmeMemoRadiSam system radical SAM enzyme [Parasutterella excrementihominis]|jgi:pyruvate formate lyase activating enzyme|uniref:AmmeMemoRadiSam system radical SAM enzyme n=1 Tax=Parasutterella excrementihominis TaxID=487175 RepID=UPI00248AD969|nr:AmmeMemoRadiSam system radical SAM enzyme [Parasutterella excrementihominis]
MNREQVLCDVCPKFCKLREGQIGFCRARSNIGGKIVPINYGQATSLALDPIEKKPLMRFCPGTYILSYGSYGCNLRCPYCQNASISMAGPDNCPHRLITPEGLTDLAVDLSKQEPGNIGVAFTYNEPTVCFEFIRDTSKLLHEAGLKSVVVTNGGLVRTYADELLPHVDALNIDLKGFSNEFYRYVKGEFDTVKEFIKAAVEHKCHVELTTLVIPTKNDDPEEIGREVEWIASISPEIPLHLSRFFPRYKVDDLPPTPAETIYRLKDIAEKKLKYVYTGNL